MKNRKSIFYICIAVMLLFGFTACTQAMTYRMPAGLTATVDKTDYIIGEAFDPSTATVTIKYTDGNTQSFKGNQVTSVVNPGSEGTSTSNAVKDVNVVKFSYGSGETEVSGSASFMAYGVKSVTLANLPTTATAVDKIDTNAITVTAVLENGTTRVLTWMQKAKKHNLPIKLIIYSMVEACKIKNQHSNCNAKK